VPLALRRAPSKPEAPTWGDRVVPDFERDIQPLFDRHCSSCHGSKEPKGGIDLSARKIDGYHQSYRTLFGLAPDAPTPFSKGYLEIWQPNAVPKTSGPADEGKAFLVRALKNPPKSQLLSLADYTSGAEVTEIRQFGSSQSRLVQTLLHDPAHLREVSLTRDEKITLMTWIDLNAPYWGSFVNKDPYYTRKKLKDPSPGTPKRVWAVFPDPWTGPPTGTWKWTAPDRVEVLP
jgi:hypothetical protein